MKQSKLKIALIVDSINVSKYVFDLAAWANDQDDITLSHLIIQKPILKKNTNIVFKFIKYLKNKGVRSFIQHIFWYLINKIEALKLKKIPAYADHLTQKSLDVGVENQIIVEPLVSKSGYVYRYKNTDIEKIRSEKIDVLIRCGSGILLGDILSAAQFGVISFHHADNRINRGGPAGFWEVYNKEPQTGFIIQQLTDELDGGNVLLRGAFPTSTYYLANQANLYTRSNYYLKNLLQSLAVSRTLPAFEDSLPYWNRLFRAPTILAQMQYCLRLAALTVKNKFKYKFLKKTNRWGVAFQRSHWRKLVMWKAARVANPSGRYLADPFVISKDGSDYCFVEDFNYAQNRGCISVLKLGESNLESIDRVIVEPFHMSFPYLFEHEGTLFMVPETAEKKDIRVYECIEFPLIWAMRSVLIDQVSAADTMIFSKDGVWWLFTNINPLNESDHCSELFIYHATEPLSKNWNPHPMNPIYIDPSRARNGGILYDGDQIYRVAQKYGFNQYGAGAKIFRIDRLDEKYFSETLVTEIEPNFFDDVLGTHHIHSNGKITVFDYVMDKQI
jgi:hypothetical protein